MHLHLHFSWVDGLDSFSPRRTGGRSLGSTLVWVFVVSRYGLVLSNLTTHGSRSTMRYLGLLGLMLSVVEKKRIRRTAFDHLDLEPSHTLTRFRNLHGDCTCV